MAAVDDGGVGPKQTLIRLLIASRDLIFASQPNTYNSWHRLFQNYEFIGLLDFWDLEVPMQLMFISWLYKLGHQDGKAFSNPQKKRLPCQLQDWLDVKRVTAKHRELPGRL